MSTPCPGVAGVSVTKGKKPAPLTRTQQLQMPGTQIFLEKLSANHYGAFAWQLVPYRQVGNFKISTLRVTGIFEPTKLEGFRVQEVRV